MLINKANVHPAICSAGMQPFVPAETREGAQEGLPEVEVAEVWDVPQALPHSDAARRPHVAAAGGIRAAGESDHCERYRPSRRESESPHTDSLKPAPSPRSWARVGRWA